MAAFITILLLSVVGSLSNFASDSSARQVQITLDLINRAMLQCYALEGGYPPDLAYLEENYGLILRHNQFIYHFEAIASNIKPMVMIIPR
jgi:hypothetical protein